MYARYASRLGYAQTSGPDLFSFPDGVSLDLRPIQTFPSLLAVRLAVLGRGTQAGDLAKAEMIHQNRRSGAVVYGCSFFSLGAGESSEYLTAVGKLYDFGPNVA